MTSPSSHNLEGIIKEYAAIVSVDCRQKRQNISKEITTSLHQINENNSQLEKVSAVHQKVIHQLPTISHQYKTLEEQFVALDKLGLLLERITADVTKLEGSVAAAEQQLLGEQPSLAQKILKPVLKKLDADADNGNRFMSNRGDLQIFNPADYLSCYTSNMKTSNSTEVNSMSSAMGACCLDDLNNITISNHHPTSSSKSGVGNQVTDQLLLDDDELCLS